jgi:hypothetical protein
MVTAVDGNRLDGGFGQDLSMGGIGRTTFLPSNAGSALDASSSEGFAQRLADPAFWGSLASQQKQELWEQGVLVQGGQTLGTLDTISNFDAARGDALELSSTLGSLTQSLWES